MAADWRNACQVEWWRVGADRLEASMRTGVRPRGQVREPGESRGADRVDLSACQRRGALDRSARRNLHRRRRHA